MGPALACFIASTTQPAGTDGHRSRPTSFTDHPESEKTLKGDNWIQKHNMVANRRQMEGCWRQDLPKASFSLARSYSRKSMSTAFTSVASGCCLAISRRISSMALRMVSQGVEVGAEFEKTSHHMLHPLSCTSQLWPDGISLSIRMVLSSGGLYTSTPSECSICGTR